MPWAVEPYPMPQSHLYDESPYQPLVDGTPASEVVEDMTSATPVNLDFVIALAQAQGAPPGFNVSWPEDEKGVYRAHLRSFGFYEKMLGSVYSKCHGLFKQSDRFRMGNHRASVVGGVASEEEDSSPGLELSRPDGRHLLSPQEWMQLGGLAQRFAPLLNGLLALQTVAGRRDA